MEQWWKDNDRGKLKYWEKKSVPRTLHLPYILHGLTLGLRMGLCGERPVTHDRSHGKELIFPRLVNDM
jgi:hypothetical protein